MKISFGHKTSKIVLIAMLSTLLIVPLLFSSSFSDRYSSGFSPRIHQRTLVSPSPQSGGYFGHEVAISGILVVVAAPFESSSGFTQAGNVYIFNASNGHLIRTLTSPNAQINGWFGTSIAINGTLVAVGAQLETASGSYEAGRVYVFNASTGHLLHTLVSPNAQLEGKFGSNLGLGTNILLVSAYNETALGIVGAGHAYTFNARKGNLLATLTSPNAQVGGFFGSGSVMYGKIAVVGADQETTFGMKSAGRAYVFNAVTGGLLSTLTSPNTQIDGFFGNACRISGNLVVVGAYGETFIGYASGGHAYTFNARTGALIATLASLNPVMDGYFGSDVSISGDNVVVSSHGETVSGFNRAGRAYTFDAKTAVLTNTFTSLNAQPNGIFGDSVVISGGVVVVGAPGETVSGFNSAGRAYIF